MNFLKHLGIYVAFKSLVKSIQWINETTSTKLYSNEALQEMEGKSINELRRKYYGNNKHYIEKS